MIVSSFYRWVIALFGIGMPDVVTVSSGTAGVAGNVVASLVTYLSERLLEVAELETVLDQLAIAELVKNLF